MMAQLSNEMIIILSFPPGRIHEVLTLGEWYLQYTAVHDRGGGPTCFLGKLTASVSFWVKASVTYIFSS